MSTDQQVNGVAKVPESAELTRSRGPQRIEQPPAPRRIESTEEGATASRNRQNSGKESGANAAPPTKSQAAATILLKKASLEEQHATTTEFVQHAEQFAKTVGELQKPGAATPEKRQQAAESLKKIGETVGAAKVDAALQGATVQGRVQTEKYARIGDQLKQDQTANSDGAIGNRSSAVYIREGKGFEPRVAKDPMKVALEEEQQTKSAKKTPSGDEGSHIPQAVSAQTARDAASRPNVPDSRPTQEPDASQPKTPATSAPTESPSSRPAVSSPSLGDLLQRITQNPQASETFADRAAQAQRTVTSQTAAEQSGPPDQGAQIAAEHALVEQTQKQALSSFAKLAVTVADPNAASNPADITQLVDHTLQQLSGARQVLDGVIRRQQNDAPQRSSGNDVEPPTAATAQRIVQSVMRSGNGDSLLQAQKAPQPAAVMQLLS